jgi:regulator of replication initiation timing
MDNIVSEINDFCGGLIKKCREYEQNRKEMEIKFRDLSYAYTVCTTEIEYMRKQNDDFLNTINRLQKQIEVIEDDKRQLTKVSNIIAIERENSRLKLEIDSLKKRLAKPTINTPNTQSIINHSIKSESVEVEVELNENPREDTSIKSGSVEVVVELNENPTEDTSIKSESVDVEVAVELNENPTEDTNNDIEVYEKKIKNVIYYVSTNEDMTIYIKEDDGAIGDKVGFLTNHNGKTKVQWL